MTNNTCFRCNKDNIKIAYNIAYAHEQDAIVCVDCANQVAGAIKASLKEFPKLQTNWNSNDIEPADGQWCVFIGCKGMDPMVGHYNKLVEEFISVCGDYDLDEEILWFPFELPE